MVVDTSALVAIAFVEPETERFLSAIDATAVRLISAASVLETGIVVEGRAGRGAGDDLDALIQRLGLDIEPVTAEQVRIARGAWRAYGKGTGHPAGLNFGDCFAYALAKATGLPLLFKGNDFAQTDIVPG